MNILSLSLQAFTFLCSQLAAYKKKKHGRRKVSPSDGRTSASNSDESSLSTSPTLLQENNSGDGIEREDVETDSSISEHILSNDESVENDRSYQEIEILNTTPFDFIVQNLPAEEELTRISQEKDPSPLNLSLKSENSAYSLNAMEKFDSEPSKTVQSILNEILDSEKFKFEESVKEEEFFEERHFSFGKQEQCNKDLKPNELETEQLQSIDTKCEKSLEHKKLKPENKINSELFDSSNLMPDGNKSDKQKKSQQNGDDSIKSNESLINIFENLNLDDASINNYTTRPIQDAEEKINFSDREERLILRGKLTKEQRNSLNEKSLESLPLDTFKLKQDIDSLKIKEVEAVLAQKDSTIAALAAELDSLRELASNTSTLSLNTTTTEYKQFQEEYQNKLVEFQNAISHRDDLIQQLTESLEQSLLNREELQAQSRKFAEEISLLQRQLTETTEFIKQHRCEMSKKYEISESDENLRNETLKTEESKEPNLFKEKKLDGASGEELKVIEELEDEVKANKSVAKIKGEVVQKKINENKTPVIEVAQINFEEACSKLEETLDISQLNLMNDLRKAISIHLQKKMEELKNFKCDELKILRDKLESEKLEYENEISRLRSLLTSVKSGSTEIIELRQELEAKHSHEMEELRTYFEKKCADLEKQ